MKVKELIEELNKLPQEATIGAFDLEDLSINDMVYIYSKTDTCCRASGNISIKEIEEFRYSNLSKVCDYYIGY